MYFTICTIYSHFADIQEFYELTLLDDTKSIQQKTVETLQIASKWEQEATLKFAGDAALVSGDYYLMINVRGLITRT